MSAWIEAKLERLAARIEAVAGSIVEFTPISRSSASGAGDAVNVQGDPRDRERPVRRVSPWGISGRPLAGAGVLAAIVKAVGGSFGGMNVGIASDTYGPQNLAVGETCIWNKVTGCTIKLDENGTLRIDVPNGQKVVVNGGSKAVARVDDTLSASATLKTWALAVEAGVAAGGGGTIAPTFAAAVGGAGALGKVATGAGKFDA